MKVINVTEVISEYTITEDCATDEAWVWICAHPEEARTVEDAVEKYMDFGGVKERTTPVVVCTSCDETLEDYEPEEPDYDDRD